MTKQEFIAELANRTGSTKTYANEYLKHFSSIISEMVVGKDSTLILQGFGTFKPFKTKTKNNFTNNRVIKCKTLGFKASSKLKVRG